MLTSTVCAAVSAAGLGIAALTAYRKRFLAATRIAAFSLVPVGLVMTGVIDWLTGVVFKPTVWAGFGVLALSVVLFMIARVAERHSSRPAAAARSGGPRPGSGGPPRWRRRPPRRRSARAPRRSGPPPRARAARRRRTSPTLKPS